MLLPVLISVALSAIIFLGLLFVTRRRLARQFQDIQRRLLGTERVLETLKLELERSTTEAQLQRLHLGLVRVQENAARRYDALIAGGRRSLTELELAALQEWAAALDVPLKSEHIEKLSQVVGRAEMHAWESPQIETPDLLAALIALRRPSEGTFAVGLAGNSARSWAPLLRQMPPGFFDEMEVFRIPEDVAKIQERNGLTAVVIDATFPEMDSALALIRENGVLVLQDGPGTESVARNFPGFKVLAGQWQTRIFEKSAA